MGGRKYKKRKKHQPKNRPAGIPDEPKTANPATCEPPQEEKYMEYKPPDSTLTVWGFVVAALVLIVYAFQLKAMLESNKTNREGLESVQRAFVTFQRTQEQRIIGREPGFSKEEHWWSVVPVLENSGTTPAQLVTNYASMDESSGEPDEQTFKGNVTTYSTASIGPKALHLIGTLSRKESFIFGNDLGDSITARLTPREKPIFVWGWVAYKDIFHKSHVTEFCAKLNNATVLPDAKTMVWNLENCKAHNCTDEYCEDYDAIASVLPKESK